MYIYIYIYIFITACVVKLIYASDKQAVLYGFNPSGPLK